MRLGPERRALQVIVPRSGRTKPQTTLNSVVLPAPLGPITPTTPPGRHLQRDVVEGDETAESHADGVQGKIGHAFLGFTGRG